jgi:enoyl-[acyl-carrier protein] reductase I
MILNLQGKRGLILGIANSHSIAYGCAKVAAELGAELCLTYLNEKSKPYVNPLAEELNASLFLPCDVSKEGELEATFEAIKQKWGAIDFVIHSIAWSPLEELHGRLVDTSRDGFTQAMDISCHSFIRAAKLAEPLFEAAGGGTLLTMSYYGSEKVVPHYDMMGPIKAALEASVRYLASELGEKKIRVHSISPGPMPTRAASGLSEFDLLMKDAIQNAPLHHLATPEDIGNMAAFYISDLAKSQTGSNTYIDAGHHIMA